jgi:hypothetical protein
MTIAQELKVLEYLLSVHTFSCTCMDGVGVDYNEFPGTVCDSCKKNVLVREVNRLRAVIGKQPTVVQDDITDDLAKEYRKGYNNEVGDWGALPQEPCRYCRCVGKVMFQVNEGQKNLNDAQVVRCGKCGRDWVADSPLA